MQSAQQEVTESITQLDEEMAKYQIFNSVSEATGVKRSHLGIGLAVFVVGFVLFGFGANPLCLLVGFVYPVYASFKAIQSVEKDDDTQWLTYWVVYGFFSLVEAFADVLMAWIPAYYLCKLIFLVWCFHPKTRGANTVYQLAIRPFLTEYEGKIDKTLDQAIEDSKDLVADASKAGRHLAAEGISAGITFAAKHRSSGSSMEAEAAAAADGEDDKKKI